MQKRILCRKEVGAGKAMIGYLKAAKARPMRRISLLSGNKADIRVITDASPEALGGILLNGKIMAAFFCTLCHGAKRQHHSAGLDPEAGS